MPNVSQKTFFYFLSFFKTERPYIAEIILMSADHLVMRYWSSSPGIYSRFTTKGINQKLKRGLPICSTRCLIFQKALKHYCHTWHDFPRDLTSSRDLPRLLRCVHLHINWVISFPGMRIPMLKMRLSQDRLIFNMGITILVRRYLYIETAPCGGNYVFKMSWITKKNIVC